MGALQLSAVQFGVVTFLAVVSFGAGMALAVDAVGRVRFQRRARREFERVDAVVVDAAVQEPLTGSGKAVPHVEYEYEVDGRSYISRSVWPTRSRAPDGVDRDVARRVVADHPTDAEVIAHYDPSDPATAYLVESFDRIGERVELALGGLLVAVALAAGVALDAGARG